MSGLESFRWPCKKAGWSRPGSVDKNDSQVSGETMIYFISRGGFTSLRSPPYNLMSKKSNYNFSAATLRAAVSTKCGKIHNLIGKACIGFKLIMDKDEGLLRNESAGVKIHVQR